MEDSQPVACALPGSPALDLTSDEDLGIGIMNLVSIEEHLFFTASKTGHPRYYELLLEVREIRKTLLKRIVVSFEGEVWCISKHLLASSMRLMEVGTKELHVHGVSAAQPYFEHSYRLFRMFWEIVLSQPEAPAAPEPVPPPTVGGAAGREVVIYFEPDCPHCQSLERFLTSHRLYAQFSITKKDVTSDAAHRAEIAQAGRACLNAAGAWEVPLVVHDGTCAMGEAAAIRLFKSLMWDGVKALRQSVASLIDQKDVPAHVKNHLANYHEAVDAALACCKE